jgi:hypothetical protein
VDEPVVFRERELVLQAEDEIGVAKREGEGQLLISRQEREKETNEMK